MDVNELIYNTLSPLVPVAFEEMQDEHPNEFIVFDRIYGDERDFSDDAAATQYYLYRVNHYGISLKQRETRMEEIKGLMKAAGFLLQTHNIPIPRESGAKYFGAYSEFARWGSAT